MEPSERFTHQVTGGTIVGEKRGRGPGLILLHAGVADRRMWKEAASYFASHYTVISYDRRGFGETSSDDVAFRHLDDLDDILARFELGPVTIIGCSQGGRIAIDFALAHPQNVSALVLVAPALSGDTSTTQLSRQVQQLLEDLTVAEQRGDIDTVNRIEAHLWLDGPFEVEGRVGAGVRRLFLDMNGNALRHPPLTREIEPPSAVDQLHSIRIPTLLVCGNCDFPHIQHHSAAIAKTLAKSRLLMLEGCAHLVNLEQPERFNRLVEGFLLSYSSQSGQ